MDQGTIKQINDHVWLLRDQHNDTCYLVAGQEKAILIDTMDGSANVREMAEQLTFLPLIVACTHGHGDHVLGNVWFDEVYLHPADLFMLEEMQADPELQEVMKKEGVSLPPCKPIRQGDVIDLGGLTLEVIETPGHTPGGVCFLLREDRMLFTGDSINRHLWMQLDGCSTLLEYAGVLESIMSVKDRADCILHGHASNPEDISLLDKLHQGLLDIVAGHTEDDTDYTWFGGVSHQHRFDNDSVIVYQDNVR